ncbi:MAG TPA: cryptochrome/photolyase family protein [Phycisphaerales bacterium]|nr:cryptochrome/photolyase family protein [Phycisphaerales bacterium]HMP36128.1 cryptochrome/photolyase family protein [Phycisphaerales bacterium]
MARRSPTADALPPHGGRLIVLFGDQLDLEAAALRERAEGDVVLMMEVAAESTEAPSHVQRTVLFLSAMRHAAAALRERGAPLRYVELDDPANTGSFEGELRRAIAELAPRSLVATLPGDWRVRGIIERVASEARLPLLRRADEHFFVTPGEFARWAEGRRSLTMEFFYREQRRRTGYLMEGAGAAARPEGGTWNFDKLNRLPFGAEGPHPRPRPPRRFEPDAITREVIAVVRRTLPGLPGLIEEFNWPVTRAEALAALEDFVTHRLEAFGPYEDAMWAGEPILHHSALSAALNLKLLSPRECCEAAIAAWRSGRAPLQSVEAFVRQLIGWREFIRGVYWLEGPQYRNRNGLDQHGALPALYWDAQTEMACLRECVGQVLRDGFAHHIQRLMVMGNFALIAGVDPAAINAWFLGMFVDGVDWATTPNVVGMSMHADRRPGDGAGTTGLVGTKPYAASGRYIERMSNYCRGCRYDPAARQGDRACPFTVFYWEFLLRNRERLGANQRMAMILRNVDRMPPEERVRLTVEGAALRRRLGIECATAGAPAEGDSAEGDWLRQR